MKDVYQHPTVRGLATALTEAPASPPRRATAPVLAEVLHAERVDVTAHFFDDLGADSLSMAHFCARVRKRDDLPTVSMKDVYQHPTVRGLATALTEATVPPQEQAMAAVLAEVLH